MKKLTFFERVELFWSRSIPEPNTGCWLWMGGTVSDGYGWFWDGKRGMGAHRFAAIISFGSIPKGMEVCHRCDNPPCVNPAHLFIGTRQDNVRDREQKNRGGAPRGDAHPMARLRATDVEDIKTLRAEGMEMEEIAARYGVSDTSIYNVLKGRTWRRAP